MAEIATVDRDLQDDLAKPTLAGHTAGSCRSIHALPLNDLHSSVLISADILRTRNESEGPVVGKKAPLVRLSAFPSRRTKEVGR